MWIESNFIVNYNVNVVRLIFAVAAVNIAGILLRYFKLDTYFLLIGFRFDISCLLPIFFIIKRGENFPLKNYFTHPAYKKYFKSILKILIPFLITLALLYIIKIIKPSNAKYFYEFGVSSIADYPIYLVWNTPQLILLFLFLTVSTSKYKSRFFVIILIVILLFGYEFVPLGKVKTFYIDYITLILASVFAATLICYYNNIYLFPVLIFTFFWLIFLLFGSDSKKIINILFAAQYDQWQGFFELRKNVRDFIIPGYLLIQSLIFLLLKGKNKMIIDTE
jgi:hypothetical protein